MGIREIRFGEMKAVEEISLRNPGGFRKLFLALACISILGGKGTSTQPAGTALLSATAAYGGLEITGIAGKPILIRFCDQLGVVIINNFDRVPRAIEAAGIPITQVVRELEGFSMFF